MLWNAVNLSDFLVASAWACVAFVKLELFYLPLFFVHDLLQRRFFICFLRMCSSLNHKGWSRKQRLTKIKTMRRAHSYPQKRCAVSLAICLTEIPWGQRWVVEPAVLLLVLTSWCWRTFRSPLPLACQLMTECCLSPSHPSSSFNKDVVMEDLLSIQGERW